MSLSESLSICSVPSCQDTLTTALIPLQIKQKRRSSGQIEPPENSTHIHGDMILVHFDTAFILFT